MCTKSSQHRLLGPNTYALTQNTLKITVCLWCLVCVGVCGLCGARCVWCVVLFVVCVCGVFELNLRHLQQETQSTTCTTGTSTPSVSTATADVAVFCTEDPSTCHGRNRHVNNLVQELHLWKYTAQAVPPPRTGMICGTGIPRSAPLQ